MLATREANWYEFFTSVRLCTDMPAPKAISDCSRTAAVLVLRISVVSLISNSPFHESPARYWRGLHTIGDNHFDQDRNLSRTNLALCRIPARGIHPLAAISAGKAAGGRRTDQYHGAHVDHLWLQFTQRDHSQRLPRPTNVTAKYYRRLCRTVLTNNVERPAQLPRTRA
ncbi:hypothetical protein D3C72_1708110 [compost metagenome]